MATTEYTIEFLPDKPTTTDHNVAQAFANLDRYTEKDLSVTAVTYGDDYE